MTSRLRRDDQRPGQPAGTDISSRWWLVLWIGLAVVVPVAGLVIALVLLSRGMQSVALTVLAVAVVAGAAQVALLAG